MTSAKIRGTCATLAVACLAAAAAIGAGCTGDNLGPDDRDVVCGEGTVEANGACIPALACGAGTRLDVDTDACVPSGDVCSPGTILVGGSCEPVENELEPDAVEAAEPNDVDGAAGDIVVPEVAAPAFIISGCVEPRSPANDGDYDADFDDWSLSVAGPAVLELESIGIGGLAPSFGVFGRDQRLIDDGWTRQSMNTTDGHAVWRLFLPAAGDYDVIATDARSVLAGLPAGGPDACYYALIRQLALPEPVPVPAPVDLFELESGVRLYAVQVAADEVSEVIGETPRLSTALALTVLSGGEYLGSIAEQVDIFSSGVPAVLDIDAVAATEVVVAVDASIDFGYAPVEARVAERRVPEPTGGAR